jgi:predicted ATPase
MSTYRTQEIYPIAKFPSISALEITGFKAIKDRTRLDIRPLTVLAGTNSSGKSSALQPLLLMKQTLEVGDYDPGPLQLAGPNVSFNNFRETLSRPHDNGAAQFVFRVEHELSGSTLAEMHPSAARHNGFEVTFRYNLTNMPSVEVAGWTIQSDDKFGKFAEGKFPIDFLDAINPHLFQWIDSSIFSSENVDCWFVERRRLLPVFRAALKVHDAKNGEQEGLAIRLEGTSPYRLQTAELAVVPISTVETSILNSIHVPGLRGRPERSYPVSSAPSTGFPGLFQNYIAALLAKNENHLVARTADMLRYLELTPAIKTRKVDDTRIEVLVDRLPVNCQTTSSRVGSDMVSIADVGIGVSQVLPVIVALEVAVPGQLVYIEQPELHLHPRAQHKLADLLVEAANRGVRVVIETHSDLLLLGIQAAVAKSDSDFDPKNLAMHWFRRNAEGFTKVDTAEVDDCGRFGDWPVDFGDVDLGAQALYLDAVEQRLLNQEPVGENVGP